MNSLLKSPRFQQFIDLTTQMSKSQQSCLKWNSYLHQPDRELNVQVRQKQLTYDAERLEWRWFKNLVIPQIDVSIGKADANRYLRVSLKCFKRLGQDHFVESPLQLLSNYNLNKGSAKLSGMKFTETCFTTRSSYFFLAVVITQHTENDESSQQEIELSDIISVSLSPPIYVEAKKKSSIYRKTVESLYQLFSIESLDKGNEGKEKPLKQKHIQSSDLLALQNYLSDRYIRNKILHPLFLVLRFPKAVKLYVNQQMLSFKSEKSENIIEKIQKTLQVLLQQEFLQSQMKSDVRPENKLLLLCLNQNQEQSHEQSEITSKISKFLSMLDGSILTYTNCLPYDVPSYFQELKYKDDLKTQYMIYYFQNKPQIMRSSDDESEGTPSNEQLNYTNLSSKDTKKVQTDTSLYCQQQYNKNGSQTYQIGQPNQLKRPRILTDEIKMEEPYLEKLAMAHQINMDQYSQAQPNSTPSYPLQFIRQVPQQLMPQQYPGQSQFQLLNLQQFNSTSAFPNAPGLMQNFHNMNQMYQSYPHPSTQFPLYQQISQAPQQLPGQQQYPQMLLQTGSNYPVPSNMTASQPLPKIENQNMFPTQPQMVSMPKVELTDPKNMPNGNWNQFANYQNPIKQMEPAMMIPPTF